MMLISILVTAAGILGLLITILAIFFQVIPSPKRNVSPKTMVQIILWLGLMVLGSVNLYYTLINDSITETDTDDNTSTTTTDENTSTTAANENTNTTAADDEGGLDTVFSQENDFLKKK